MPFNNWPDYGDEYPPPRLPPGPPDNTPGGGGPTFPVIDPSTRPPPPPPDGGDGGPGGGGGGYPLPAYPAFNIPGAPKFMAPVFHRPTMEEAKAEPGYQFRSQAGADALERSAAAAGRLRTGGTLSDLMEYGQNFAAQEYNNVFNRAMGAYGLDYTAAHDAYAPLFAQWQMKAGGEKDAQLARYQADLSHWLQASAPRPEPDLSGLLPGVPEFPGGDGGSVGSYSQGYPWPDNRNRSRGYPWPDENYY